MPEDEAGGDAAAMGGTFFVVVVIAGQKARNKADAYIDEAIGKSKAELEMALGLSLMW